MIELGIKRFYWHEEITAPCPACGDPVLIVDTHNDISYPSIGVNEIRVTCDGSEATGWECKASPKGYTTFTVQLRLSVELELVQGGDDGC